MKTMMDITLFQSKLNFFNCLQETYKLVHASLKFQKHMFFTWFRPGFLLHDFTCSFIFHLYSTIIAKRHFYKNKTNHLNIVWFHYVTITQEIGMSAVTCSTVLLFVLSHFLFCGSKNSVISVYIVLLCPHKFILHGLHCIVLTIFQSGHSRSWRNSSRGWLEYWSVSGRPGIY